MSNGNDEAYWSKTKGLMYVCIAVWVFFGYIIHLFVDAMNQIVIFNFPLGFWMGAQGSLIAFVVLIFWFSSRPDAIDREFGVAED
ncbi:MAG: DUF4212 domain-containing protein [Pseudomonadota bacterium]